MNAKIPISIPEVCAKVTAPFSQTLVANVDGSFDIKHALLHGSVPFHNHPDNDEAFYILSGRLTIEMSTSASMQVTTTEGKVDTVELKAGDIFVVPRGIYHRPIGDQAHVLLMESKGIPGGNGEIAKDVQLA